MGKVWVVLTGHSDPFPFLVGSASIVRVDETRHGCFCAGEEGDDDYDMLAL
jgi:hypothetical protein